MKVQSWVVEVWWPELQLGKEGSGAGSGLVGGLSNFLNALNVLWKLTKDEKGQFHTYA